MRLRRKEIVWSCIIHLISIQVYLVSLFCFAISVSLYTTRPNFENWSNGVLWKFMLDNQRRDDSVSHRFLVFIAAIKLFEELYGVSGLLSPAQAPPKFHHRIVFFQKPGIAVSIDHSPFLPFVYLQTQILQRWRFREHFARVGGQSGRWDEFFLPSYSLTATVRGLGYNQWGPLTNIGDW